MQGSSDRGEFKRKIFALEPVLSQRAEVDLKQPSNFIQAGNFRIKFVLQSFDSSWVQFAEILLERDDN